MKQFEKWYKEHQQEVIDIIQSSYLIEKPPWGRIMGKVDMTGGYMKDEIGYSIILLNRVLDLPIVGHCNTFMVNFIETIKQVKIPLDWATTLSENLCEQFGTIKDKKKFYMTSYMVYLLAAKATNYIGLYKKSNMQDPNA